MKVIEYGHIKPLYAKCNGCGAILEFVKKDTRMSNMHLARGPQHDGRDYIVNCPVCGRAIYEMDFYDTLSDVNS